MIKCKLFDKTTFSIFSEGFQPRGKVRSEQALAVDNLLAFGHKFLIIRTYIEAMCCTQFEHLQLAVWLGLNGYTSWS